MELKDYLALPYTIVLKRDDEGDWVAQVQELEGCLTHGSTQAEALDRLEEAKTLWLESALTHGIPIPAPTPDEALPSGKWVQRVPRRLHRSLARLAKTEGVSLNQLVVMILSQYLGASSSYEPKLQEEAASHWAIMPTWEGTFRQTFSHAPGRSLQVTRLLSSKMPGTPMKFRPRAVEEEEYEVHAGKR
jgi:antitoxin HicB